MKIGILTFHRAKNYGAVLQAFALQKYLCNLGHETYFIDYKKNTLLEVYKPFLFKRFKSKNPIRIIINLFFEFKYWNVRTCRNKRFELFINKYLSIDKDVTLNHINECYDLVIIGSDQVWNYQLTGGFDSYYWGEIKLPGSKLKLASYAASMEAQELTEKEQNILIKRLAAFDYLSVRESVLQDRLLSFIEQKISLTVDPTLLLDLVVWNKIAVKPAVSKPYLLLYQVRNDKSNEDFAGRIAQRYNLEIICLSARADLKNSKSSKYASPEEFLGLFKYADFVVCTSFHGTIFSLLFNIPFFSIIMNDGKNTRVLSLLESLGLTNRAVLPASDPIDEKIDWDIVQEKLVKLSEDSKKYLQEIIK